MIAESAEHLDVSTLRFGVAGDIDDLLRLQLRQRVEEACGTAGAGRVDESDVDALIAFGEFSRVQLAVGGGEADVPDPVLFRVQLRVADRGGVQLDGKDLFCLA